ncbi:lipocalin family protein [Flavobacterium sp. GT3R68]|uniref:lipocalin family protein n=1 Tax=Flavobacterium sp. GT3R68 TaxID=2594437 RepID=UPI000F893AAB|nr:lipocalin family protein [Flavobacterium sp. GT3R68]RTY86614.1 hypothetical protein EKL32_27420 [Flavobacterium sp. GSN2]TRW92351.1 hypothetical protein FNW07_04910 [Flavobacterium sp. GT3R68]
MKKIYALLCLLVLMSCQQKVTEKDISKMNGYWEIEKVVLPDGSEKEYSINETFEYFKIKNNIGFRKKVKPQLNGRFIVDDQSGKLEIVFKNEKTYINYSTAYAKWKEELKSLSDEKMVIINSQNSAYHYKKAGPINLLEDGKKTQ